MAEKFDAIILSVGKTWEPILYTLQQFQPRFAAFLCTPESSQTLDRILAEYSMLPSHYRVFQVPDNPNSIGLMVTKCYEAYTWLRDEINLDPEWIIIDPTAGRKWMSSGVTMIASYLGVNMAYVDVRFEEGKPVPSTMKIVNLGNAYDQTGFLEIERGIQFFNTGAWENARETFQKIRSHNSALNDLAIALMKISDLMKRWDLFLHYKENLSKDFEEISQILARVSFSDESHSETVKGLIKEVERLKMVSDRIYTEKRPNLLLTVDLLLNAKRCIDKGRFDDGVARIYRVLESLAQYYLQKDYGFSTDKPDFQRMDPQIVGNFQRYKGGRLPQNLGLEDDYILLYFAKHPLLGKAVITGFSDKDQKPKNVFHKLLEKRNNSIMAHGFEPIEQNVAMELFKKTEDLLKDVLGEEFNRLKEELFFPTIPPFFKK